MSEGLQHLIFHPDLGHGLCSNYLRNRPARFDAACWVQMENAKI